VLVRTSAALALFLLAPPLGAELRQASFTSAALGREVRYVVDLPPSYDSAPARRYPVVYVLHGLFEGPGFWEGRGLAAILADLRAKRLPEFLVVVADGGNSFFVNAKGGRYQDMLEQDLLAHVEATWRVAPGRSGRGLLGISMGGYGALNIAFKDPAIVAAVATHSAMLLEQVPSAEQGARRGQMSAFFNVFGDPIDLELWRANDPLARARSLDAKSAPALYLDCGAEDRYGLANGHRQLHKILEDRGVPHSFELPPGDHGYEFVRARLEKSLRFLGERLR
jgi:S-formylglutathione hydrolase FrmB